MTNTFIFMTNAVFFQAKRVIFEANTVVLGANIVIFWTSALSKQYLAQIKYYPRKIHMCFRNFFFVFEAIQLYLG